MMHRGFLLLLLLSGLLLGSGDVDCPAYPYSQRVADAKRREDARLFASFSAQAHARRAPLAAAAIPASANFIDDFIFGRMAADGVNPAPLTSDAEFLHPLSGKGRQLPAGPGFLEAGKTDRRSDGIGSLCR
jgi:hypothetical protein